MNLTGLIRLTLSLAVIIFLTLILYHGSGLLVPLSLAALLAMLLNPLVNRLIKWRIPKVLAIILAIIMVLIILASIVYLLTTQLMMFAGDIPEISKQINNKFNSIQSFIQGKTNISAGEQMNWIKQKLVQWLENSGSTIQNTITATTNTIAMAALLPIYIFFFIFYGDKFRNFLLLITPDDRHHKVETMIDQIKEVVQNYLVGVLIVMAVLAVLDIAALTIIGIKYAVFLGLMAAILNIIPYIGVLIGNLLAATVAFITKDSIWYTVAVLATFFFIQFIENNVLTPNITGSKVRINPLATVIALIIGGHLWGVAGMILFIPFLGILKVIFDNVDTLAPYGYLLGTNDSDEDDVKKKKMFKITTLKPRNRRTQNGES